MGPGPPHDWPVTASRPVTGSSRAGTAFDRLASPAAVELVRTLDADPAPLLAALDELPATGLHGDLKLSNVAPLADGRIALIDWQMTMLAPVAVELGWLLVGNSGVLPDRPDVVLEAYRRAIAALDGEVIRVGAPYDDRCAYPSDALAAVFGEDEPARSRSADAVLGDWAAQVDLAWIIGLLLRGWRKGTRRRGRRRSSGRVSRRPTTSAGGATGPSRPPGAVSSGWTAPQLGAARSRRGKRTSARDDRDRDDRAEHDEVASRPAGRPGSAFGSR